MKFAGKVVAITGAASGIGRSLALECGRKNAQIAAIDSDSEALADLDRVCRREGFEVRTYVCDVTISADLHRTMEQIIADLNAIDLWINNAGIAINHRLEKISLADFQRSIAVNLTAVVDASQIALKHMQDRGTGIIVNMASVAGHVAAPYMSAYSATKHAVVGFTRSLQAELEFDDSPVRAVLVSPGFVETAMIKKGADLGFPKWMGWMLDSPNNVARRIVKGLEAGHSEILPTANGKAMIRAHKFWPKLTIKSSRLLLTGSFKDFVLNRYKIP